jgi:hypothetical protein
LSPVEKPVLHFIKRDNLFEKDTAEKSHSNNGRDLYSDDRVD